MDNEKVWRLQDELLARFPPMTEQEKQAWETMGQAQMARQYVPPSPSIYTAILGNIGGAGAKSLNLRKRIWTISAQKLSILYVLFMRLRAATYSWYTALSSK